MMIIHLQLHLHQVCRLMIKKQADQFLNPIIKFPRQIILPETNLKQINQKNNTTDTSAEKTQATQPRGKRKQNSSNAPATEHSTRPSRSSILRQSTRSKTSEGAPISESKNALDALAENIAKLTTQNSQQDNHPTYTQADVEDFLKKSGNKVSDNEVTIRVRGGDVTINGNPLENT